MDIEGIVRLGKALRELGYHFTTVTPETHRRVFARPVGNGTDPLREFFGWNRAMPIEDIPQSLRELLLEEFLEVDGSTIRSKLRFSTLGDDIFAHSAYPTDAADSVFFGPDSYRFARFLKQEVRDARKVLDIGCGSGVGGLMLARRIRLEALYLTDISPLALKFARANSELMGEEPHLLESDLLEGVPLGIDTIIANPPFVIDPRGRVYRDGGAMHGTELSVRIVREVLRYLAAEGGQLYLYTGTAVVNGRDVFREQIDPLIRGLDSTYEEIDPDIFGEELSGEAYRDVERIAAVGLTLRVT